MQSTNADCCVQCSQDDDCNAFTWIRDSHECWVHRSIGDGGNFNLTTYAGHRRDGFIWDRHSNGSFNNSSINDGEVQDSLARIKRTRRAGKRCK
ncbi:unnamed protein product [Adineta steineri]|uniref:Apple domain-containing protein n=1 Tax=Adineta steineri TaxID=433720 RepID=A0A815BQ93_9BILA|nr:unnamed protein product [Adineta steineri]CAF1559489.1 unnamed protein product [Adineta steineri]